MTDMGDGEQEPGWRHYYDNPISVSTSEMIHLHGEPNSSQTHYEIYKEEPMDSSSVGGTLELKLANTTADITVGAEHVENIFLQGGVDGVKREPEDLTRKCISPIDRCVVSDKRRLVPLSSHSGSPPALIPTQHIKDDLESAIKDEGLDRPRAHHTIVIQAPLESGEKMSGYLSTFAASSPQANYEAVQYLAQSPQSYTTSTSPAIPRSSSTYHQPGDPYYREYYQLTSEPFPIRQEYGATEVSFERYPRPVASYRTLLTVDSSPDSGISSDTLSAKEQVVTIPQHSFSYEDLNQPTILTTDLRAVAVSNTSPGPPRSSPCGTPAIVSRGCYDFPRHADSDKIQIPKIHSDDDKIYIEKVENIYGFKYYFESPISTSPRKEDDRITYINKGQFYPITLEYIPDPDRIRKPGMVKSVIMLLFREEKSAEDERKSWHFWHGRQHSTKQRILDIDTKNSVGISGCVDELSHNAITVYWNTMESCAKVNIAVQCLSTDFSSQKGVKGLPLHIQIDTYEAVRDSNIVTHRGYCQIKVFCDKGAERKTRDEERRAQKRRVNPSSRKKYDDLYHASSDRSEFYSMADLIKEPVLFNPPEDVDKVSYMSGMDIQGPFYTNDTDNGVCGQPMVTGMDGASPISPQHMPSSPPSLRASLPTNTSPGPLVATHVPTSVCSPPPSNINSQENISFTTLAPLEPTVSPKMSSLRFQHSLSQQYGDFQKDITHSINNPNNISSNNNTMDDIFIHPHKRTRLTPHPCERVMIFVRREDEDIYNPLHLVPPVMSGLYNAIEVKYMIPRSQIKHITRINKAGIRSRMDDDMLRYFCNEECFLLDIHRREQDTYEITLTEQSIALHDQ